GKVSATKIASGLDRNRRLNRRVRVVVEESKIFKAKVLESGNCRIYLHARQGPALAVELLTGLFQVILVKMEVAESMDEVPRPKAAHLRNHHCKQRVARNVEGHAEK